MTSPGLRSAVARRRSRGRTGLRSALLAALLGVAPAACKSAAERVAEADREVYDLIAARRDALLAGGDFSIEPPATSLRQRILTGETTAEDLPPLELVDALDIAAENSRDYQDRREALYITGLDLTLERWAFSTQERGILGGVVDGDGDGAEEADVFGAFGFSKLLLTGARVVGDISIDLVRDLSQGDGWDALGNFSLNIAQPLLRGFGRDIVREPLTQAERNVLYEARNYERFRQTFAFDVASRYYRILQLADTLENERANHERLTGIRERNENFAQAGRTSDIEVDQARQEELSAEISVVDAVRDLDASLDAFKFFLGLPPEFTISLHREPKELDLPDPFELGLTEEGVLEVALDARFDYQTVADRVEDAQRRVHVAEDALRAGLTLVTGISGTSETDQPLEFDSEAVRWDASLSLDLPLERLPERNAYRTELIRLEAAERERVEAEDTIKVELRAALRSLAAARESYEIQTGAVILAERRAESAALNLEAGRASTRDLLEAQESRVQAENAATRALTDYTLARLAFFRDLGLLRVDEDGVAVEIERMTTTEEDGTP